MSPARKAFAAALTAAALLCAAAPAAAAGAEAPWWALNSQLRPATLSPGGEATLVVKAVNVGDAATAGPVTLADTLPEGIAVEDVHLYEAIATAPIGDTAGGVCQIAAQVVSCSSQKLEEESKLGPLQPYEDLEMRILLKDEGAAAGATHRFAVSGGGAGPASLERALPIGEGAVPFGVEDYALVPEEEGGQVDTRAGSHPFQITTTFNLDQTEDPLRPPASPRNLHFKLPPGQIGSATAVEQCSALDFAHGFPGGSNLCPPDTAIGVAAITIDEPVTLHLTSTVVPLFNLAPAYGEPARFGFEFAGAPVILDTAVRSGAGEDYGVTVNVSNISQLADLLSSTVTFWGAPGDPRHDSSRGWSCLIGGHWSELPCENHDEPHPRAFLTLPTNCAAPYATTVEGDSWPYLGHPSQPLLPFTFDLTEALGLGLDACNQVPFKPEIQAEPTTRAAGSASGLDFAIDFEDEGLENPEGIAQSQIKKALVTLPEGFTIDASLAEGLAVCAEAEYEASTVAAGSGCREDSKIGTAEVKSPLIPQALEGSIYVAEQENNPYHNLTTLYLVLRNPEAGILVKQALKVTPDPRTGRLQTEVDDIPQLPFSQLRLSLRQGQRAPLITPPGCGTYAVQAELYPWSEPSSPLHRESSFQIVEGPEGKPCPQGAAPFQPGFEALSVNNQAASYSPFVLRLTRKDGEQDMTKLSAVLPPGMLGKLAGLSRCPQASVEAAKRTTGRRQLASPSCPASSQIGRTVSGAGVGSTLVYVPGSLYLGGPYHGDPLSVIAIVPAVAGPFDVGTVVVQEALTLNPVTAEVEVDGAASDPIPHSLAGIPLNVRKIEVLTDRPQFTLNPTGCDESSTRATLWGGGTALFPTSEVPVPLSSRFQAAGCAALGFKPKLKLRLKGATKRGRFPALHATYTPHKGDADLSRLALRFPKSEFIEQGHFRTICTRVQFAAGPGNGAGCPKGSVYGHVTVTTPLLEEPLSGPVYLRSSNHNLPDAVFALSAPLGVHVDVSVRIDSSHGGLRATVEGAPDAPVTRAVVKMGGGQKGLFVNSTNICAAKHRAKVDALGQNGKRHEARPLLKAQCGKAKRKGHKKHHKKRSRR